MEQHKDEKGNLNSTVKTVEIFSTPTCHFCHAAKEWFDEVGIKYTDHDVSVNKEELARMMEITGQRGVPVIIIGNDVVIGFDQNKLKELLGM